MIDVISLTIRALLGILLIFISFHGWGWIIGTILKKKFNIWDNLWVGFTFLILLLQVIHLFIKIDLTVSIVILGIGTLCGIISLLRNVKKEDISKNWLPILVVFILLILISSQIFRESLGYDFGLYYRQTMNWIQNFPIIKGLANIHERFGFNNGSFLVTSLIDNLEIIPQSFRLFSSGLCIFVIIKGFISIYSMFKKRLRLNTIYWSLCFFFAISLIFSRYFINGGADAVTLILELVIGGYILSILSKKSLGKYYYILIITLAGLFCTKLSTGVFVIGCLLVILYVLIKYERPLLKEKLFWIFSIIFLLLASVWFLRSVILSGYMLYPSTAISINVDWSVTKESANLTMDWIESFAKNPLLEPSQIPVNLGWFPDWLNVNIYNSNLIMPFIFSAVFFCLSIFSKFWKNRYWLLLLVLIPALGYWFIKVPDIRFASAMLWMTFIYIFIIFLKTRKVSKDISSFIISSVGIFFVLFTSSGYSYVEPSEYLLNTKYPEIETQVIDVQGKYNIYKPSDDRCWDQEFICTPTLPVQFELVFNDNGDIEKVLSKYK